MMKVVATMVAMVLFSMSSAAVACDLSCSLRQLNAGCAVSGVRPTDQQTTDSMSADMPGMDMSASMDMPMDGAASGVATEDASVLRVSAETIAATPCAHDACAQNAASTGVRVFASRFQVQYLPIIGVSIVAGAPHTAWAQDRAKSPPLLSNLLDTLVVSLRV